MVSVIKVLSVAVNRCVGCRLCEIWCSYSHHGVVSPSRSRIRVLRDLDGEKDVPLVCRQCTAPLCIKACPAGALSRDEVTGVVKVNRDQCAGCLICVEACPRGGIGIDTEGYPLVCDLCGGKPRCAAHCPEGAVKFQRRDLADREKKLNAERSLGE